MAAPGEQRIPTWLKVAYTLWMAVWVAAYWIDLGAANFLWLCDLANFVVAAALWLESPLLVASQALSVLLIQILWMVDCFTRLLFGFQQTFERFIHTTYPNDKKKFCSRFYPNTLKSV